MCLGAGHRDGLGRRLRPAVVDTRRPHPPAHADGRSPQWSAAAAASAFPSLVGHIGYGIGLGGFSTSSRPGSASATPAALSGQAPRRRGAAPDELAAGPLWAALLVLLLTIPVVVSGATGS